jgi:hypothetical protein
MELLSHMMVTESRIGIELPRGPFSSLDELNQNWFEYENPGSGTVPPPVRVDPGEYAPRTWANPEVARYKGKK